MASSILKTTTLALYVLLTVVLATATLVEHTQGTAFATEHIYHSVPFMVLWGVLSVLMIFSFFAKGAFQVWPKVLLHFSFLVILAGALTTYLTSSKGIMHLRQGEHSFQYMEEGTRLMRDLPFTLTLDTFYIDYYPGTKAPADYVSIATSDELRATSGHAEQDSSLFALHSSLTHTISMNTPLDHQGYRFYQSSYDEDGRGTWLSVNYDPWGTGLTYTGYLLLLIAMIGMMVHPRGGFRRLLKKATSKCDTENGTRMKRKEQTDTEGFSKSNDELRNEKEPVSFRLFRFIGVPLLMAVMAFAFVSGTFAQGTKKLPIVPLEEAEEKVGMQVIYHDRVVPLNTLARDFVKKLYGKDSFSGLTPEQILLSWQRHPEEWAYVPAIKIKSAELRAALGIEGKYARMVDLFEFDKMTTYRLKPYIRDFSAPTDIKPSPLQKAAIETDEKVALVMMLQNGTLIRPLPTDGSVEPLSKEKLQAELLYNRIPFTKILFMFNLTMGIVFILVDKLTRYKLTRIDSVDKIQVGKLTRNGAARSLSTRQLVNLSTKLLLLVALTFHLTGYLLRWYIGGRIPLSNGYETMQFLALCIMAFALFMSRRFRPALGFGFLLSGFTLLVAYLGQMNPQITPLMPVLVSPWLSLHVSVIMMAYALFAFILLNGVWALCLPREAEQLMTYSRLLLYPAVFLLTAGIFIGAVWANVSWGRYWGWDPKEVWALITMLLYALPLHAASLPWFKRPKFFHIYLILAFLAVLITYFGVNFFLGGMHSYA